MSIKRKACLVGAFEHPTRKAEDKSVAQLHAEVAKGALDDAGLTRQDVDGYFCAGDAPGLGPLSMVDYMGLKVRHMESTDTGGSICSMPPDPQADRICNEANDPAWPTLARCGQIASKRGDSGRFRGLMVIERGGLTPNTARFTASRDPAALADRGKGGLKYLYTGKLFKQTEPLLLKARLAILANVKDVSPAGSRYYGRHFHRICAQRDRGWLPKGRYPEA